MKTTLDELLAESAIKDIQMRYCRAADRGDFELFRTCFHADGFIIFSFFSGGVDEFIAWAKRGLAQYTCTTHFTGNCLVRVNGDSAQAEHYTLATHRMPADADRPEQDYIASLRYIDQLERRDGEWRIARRRCVLDWARTDPVPDYCVGAKTGETRRDRSDPSYSEGSF